MLDGPAVEVRRFEARDQALRAQAALRRRGIASGAVEEGDVWLLEVAEGSRVAAEDVLRSFDQVRDLSGMGRPSFRERFLNLEILGVGIALVAGLTVLVVYGGAFSFYLQALGVVGLLVVGVGALVFVVFGGHGQPAASAKPQRLSGRHGPLTQAEETDITYRRAWIREVWVGHRRAGTRRARRKKR